MLCASLMLSLNACASSDRLVVSPVKLPAVPSYIRQCISKGLVPIPKGSWTSAQVEELVARLIVSEGEKKRCGVELLRFYDKLRGLK